MTWRALEGLPSPLGVTWIESQQAYNFAVFSRDAESVSLLFFGDCEQHTPSSVFHFDFLRNKSGPIWHCRIAKTALGDSVYYAYSVSGPNVEPIDSFDPQKLLLDPYAHCVVFPGTEPLAVLPPAHALSPRRDSSCLQDHHESSSIIYELHVRGFTKQDPNNQAAGTFAALARKIPYLLELGVTVVELMPIFQRDRQDDDYWGYMPLNFFSPHHSYSSGHERGNQHEEFRSMVDAFHAAGIEVILDVVYNHTAERDHRGPIYSFKGFASSEYYMASGDPDNPYANYAGTGNTLNVGSPYVRQMILASLRYWRNEMHVDGFRFDLASIFSRNPDGSLNLDIPPIFAEIAADPDLGALRLIAEPWDAAGVYQLGRSFPGVSWLQWNGKYRDDIRCFVKGDPGMVPHLMRRLYGSDDLFPDDRHNAYHAFQSVNFITCHDGFTLYDLVSYNQKNNWQNGEQNRDGMDQNHSWNCGVEGDDGVTPEVMALRRKQIKNFCCLLMLSNGTPMFRAGDEFMQTQKGNNNPYNQDNQLSWLDWDLRQKNASLFRFFQSMISFRKSHPSLCRSRFWRNDVRWYGVDGPVDTSYNSHTLAFCLLGASQGDDDLYVLINAYWEPLQFRIQEGHPQEWKRIVDTSLDTPNDYSETGAPLASSTYVTEARSVVILLRHTNPPH